MSTLESEPSRPQPTGLQVELAGKPGRRLSVRLLILLFLSLAVVGSATVWLYAQPRRGTGTFGPTQVAPAYIAVNTPTPVTFTVQIADGQLKKRSVLLLRLDASGQPSEIPGRLKDDGRNGDARANDNIYTFRTTLNEPAIGQVGFRVAARFKPGKWREPEPDDDDWDKDLAELAADRKTKKHRLSKLLRKLGRYTLSDPIQLSVFNVFTDATLGVTFAYPPSWTVHSSPHVTYFTVPPDIGVLSISIIDVAGTPSQLSEAAIADNNCPASDINGQPSDHKITGDDASGVLYVLSCSATTDDYHYVFLNTRGQLVDITYHDDFDSSATEDVKTATFRQIIDSLR